MLLCGMAADDFPLWASDPSATDQRDGGSDYVMRLTPDWRITYLNAAARRLLVHETRLIGRSLWDLFPKSYSTEARRRMEQAVATGQGTQFQFYGPDLEGWFDLTLRVLPSGIEIAFRDTSNNRDASQSSADGPLDRRQSPSAGQNVELARLAEEICRLAEQISRVSPSAILRESPQEVAVWTDRRLASVAELIYRGRRLRNQHFPNVEVAEPKWDILLDLFVQTVAGQPVSVSSACVAANVPNTTALRALRQLAEDGLIERRADALDRRRTWVVLTPQAKKAMVQYLKAWIEDQP